VKKKPKKTERSAVKGLLPTEIPENELIQDLRQTVEKLKVFDSLGKAITSSLDLSDVLRILVEKLGALIHCKHIGLVLIDPETNDAYFEFPTELKEKRVSFLAGTGILGRCLERGKGGLYLSPMNESTFSPDADAVLVPEPSSLLTLPIMSRGSVLGLLVFCTVHPEAALGESDFRTIETFSDYISIAVENARNFQKVRELTVTDDLTKLYNSRYLHLVLERELARSERYNENFSIVFIDIDNFKAVNDTNGHMVGSLLLKEFGDFLVSCVRTSDVAIRYGGDEFVLVLPNTSKQEAVLFLTRCRDLLKEHIFVKQKQMNLKITASFGV